MSEAENKVRIKPVDPEMAKGKAKRVFERLQSTLGLVPNLVRVLGNSPAALEGYVNLGAAVSTGSFNQKIREQIALTVAEINLCSYCLSAHTYLAEKAGLAPAEIANATRASASAPKVDAILKLARTIVNERGQISDSDLERAQAAGLTDSEIVETLANVVLCIFTNYVNHMARTEIDFPQVKPSKAA